MSKLIEKFKLYTQPAVQTLGFQRNITRERPRLVLIADTSYDKSATIKKLTGADAFFTGMQPDAKTLDTIEDSNTPVTEIIRGTRLDSNILQNMSNNPEFSVPHADFFIFSYDTPLVTLPASSGRIIEIDSSTSDTLLRALEDLPVDAIFLRDDTTEKITWGTLNLIQRVDNLTSRFLLVKVSPNVNKIELEMLWRVGIDGIIVDTEGIPADQLSQIRNTIEQANFPLQRKVKKPDVILPFLIQDSTVPDHEEEEEGDEDED